jgi:hypothetical protein
MAGSNSLRLDSAGVDHVFRWSLQEILDVFTSPTAAASPGKATPRCARVDECH